jgi:hypothetical protein
MTRRRPATTFKYCGEGADVKWSDINLLFAGRRKYMATQKKTMAPRFKIAPSANGSVEAEAKAQVELPDFDIRRIKITLVGESPLVCHRWPEKAKKQILDKQMGKATVGKEKKDPEADFHSSLYPHPDGGYGFPAIAFKSAAVDACTSLGKAITKVAVRQAFHLRDDWVKIEGEPNMREDMVRVGMGSADIRYRAEFRVWRCCLVIDYNSRVLTQEQIIGLFRVAGFAVGVGEWRPQKNGSMGRFNVS